MILSGAAVMTPASSAPKPLPTRYDGGEDRFGTAGNGGDGCNCPLYKKLLQAEKGKQIIRFVKGIGGIRGKGDGQ